MRHTKESKMKNGIETMMIAVLCVVVLSLLFSIHVQSREADAAFTNTAYYQEQEKQYRKDCRKILDAYGCYDSGITMTRVVEADGRTYQLEIHNAHFAVMTEKERNELKEALTTEFFGAQNPQTDRNYHRIVWRQDLKYMTKGWMCVILDTEKS